MTNRTRAAAFPTVDHPGAVWVGSPFYGYPQLAHGRGMERVTAIVDHIMDGTLDGEDTWFSNPASQVSAHYGVGKNGAVHQYVREADAAWGAGILNQPDTTLPWLDAHGSAVNQRVISIEHEGHPGDAVTPAQLAATIALHRRLVAQYGIPVDTNHIVGHNRLDSVNRAHCPGPAFPWPALFAALAPQPQPTPPPTTSLTAAQVTELLANYDVIWGNAEAIRSQFPQAAAEIQSAVVNAKRVQGLP